MSAKKKYQLDGQPVALTDLARVNGYPMHAVRKLFMSDHPPTTHAELKQAIVAMLAVPIPPKRISRSMRRFNGSLSPVNAKSTKRARMPKVSSGVSVSSHTTQSKDSI